MMRFDPTAPARYPAALDEPDCPACATGWHPVACIPTSPTTATASWSSAAATDC
jgi:hypothetical protein